MPTRTRTPPSSGQFPSRWRCKRSLHKLLFIKRETVQNHTWMNHNQTQRTKKDQYILQVPCEQISGLVPLDPAVYVKNPKANEVELMSSCATRNLRI